MIKKGERVYMVTETADAWKVSRKDGKLGVVYNVSKSVCRTYEELADYINTNDIF